MKKIDELITRFQEFKEELNKNVNQSYAPQSNSTHMANSPSNSFMSKDEEAKPKKGHSSFTMDHVNAVVKMPHHEAKAHAHAAVDSSTANPANKAKMKAMINSSKSSSHLAQGMSNHILAHPSEGLKVSKSDIGFAAKNDEVLKTDKNGQWKLEKDFSGPTARALAAKHPMPSAAPAVGKEYSGPAARALAAKHPMPSAAEASASKKNSMLDARRGNVLKVDPEENVNIPHPKGKAKMSDGVNKGEGKNEEAASSKPHNKGKFKVMDEAEEKNSKKEDVKGLPYNGKDKKK